MAGKPRLFSTVPARAIADDRLSGLDWRVLAGVSIRDGMSLVKGKGAGCYASNVTLAADVGCEYSSLSKSLARLLEYGYLKMERQADDKRMTTYRVRFEAPDSWPNRQGSGLEVVGGTANQPQKVVGQDAVHGTKVVGRASSENGANQPQTAEHYIPLKGELDSVETEELNSSEEAHLAARHAQQSRGASETARSIASEVALFERRFREDWTQYNGSLHKWVSWLTQQHEDLFDEDLVTARRAERLADEVHEFIELVAFEQQRDPATV